MTSPPPHARGRDRERVSDKFSDHPLSVSLPTGREDVMKIAQM